MKIVIISLEVLINFLLIIFIVKLILRLQKIRSASQKIFYDFNRTLKGVLEQQDAILDVIPDLIWIKDCDSKFLVVNKAFQRFFKLDRLDIIGKTDFDIFDKDLAEKYHEDDFLVISTKKTHIFEESINGKKMHIISETIKTPVLDNSGKVVGTLGIAHDITQRKKDDMALAGYRQELEELVARRTLEVEKVSQSLSEHVKEHVYTEIALKESEQKFEALLEKMAEGFIVLDSKEKFLFANEKFCQMLEYSKNEIIGHYGNEFVVGDSFFKDLSQKNKKKSKEIPPYEISLMTKTKKKVDVLVSPTELFKDDKFMGSTCILLDLTQFKKTEHELKRSNESLEQFAFVASHDLQEPLRMITSYLTMLAKRTSSSLDDKSNEYLNHAIDSANYMHVLIKDLLEYSRIKKGDEKDLTVSLNSVLEKVKHNLEPSIRAANAKVIVKNLPSVLGDEMRYIQLFQNLISNGLKFKSEKREPVIEISVEDTGVFWLFVIKDNGIGIAKKDFDKIFRVFARLSSEDKYSGTGIGLAICKNVVESLGGTIWVESVKDEGSSFCFTIPKQK
ncbi:MAG: PAS domain S-box protein [Candidatus Omnitrophica bacterium]|nr:PAS domain S-box protein [Candidatus Omnitrophota bacterium]